MAKARIKRLTINPEMLFMIMETNSAWRVTQGVPASATFKGVTLDPHTQIIHIFIEHPSFDEITLESEVAPKLETLFKKIQ